MTLTIASQIITYLVSQIHEKWFLLCFSMKYRHTKFCSTLILSNALSSSKNVIHIPVARELCNRSPLPGEHFKVRGDVYEPDIDAVSAEEYQGIGRVSSGTGKSPRTCSRTLF